MLDIALKRLIDGVGRRKAGRRNGLAERDLFGEYANIPQIVIIGDKKRKPIAELSIREAENYVEMHLPRAVSEQHDAFKRMVDDCQPYRLSDDDTIGELLVRRKQSIDEDSKSAFSWDAESPTSSVSTASKDEPALAK